MRLDRDHLLMMVAGLFSERGTCSRLRVGAVLARNYRIFSTGYNGPPSGMPHCGELGAAELGCNPQGECDYAVHAEANAIAFAARNGTSTEEATMYSSTAPCAACARLIINAGVTRVFYVDEYRNRAGIYLLRVAEVPCERLSGSRVYGDTWETG